MVALYSSDFKLYSDTSSITPPQLVIEFQDAFQNWKNRWERCIKSGGEYFAGDKFD